ncbi:hypothetical protein Sjap_016345 [Stephania japonica]|uniref:Uncharacterized protein n=1 Tax=Stephania japonica TaxID=461633 RepID=A0AAP0NSA4_9MAGN
MAGAAVGALVGSCAETAPATARKRRARTTTWRAMTDKVINQWCVYVKGFFWLQYSLL